MPHPGWRSGNCSRRSRRAQARRWANRAAALGLIAAEQCDGQQSSRTNLIGPGELAVVTVGDRHGHACFIDAQPGSHLGERAVRAVIGAGQQTAQSDAACSRPATWSGGRRDSSRLAPIITGPHAVGLEADEDETHGTSKTDARVGLTFEVRSRSLYMMAKTAAVAIAGRATRVDEETRMNKQAIALLSLGHFLIDFCQGVVPALVPFLVTERHFSYAAAAGLVFAISATSSVVQPLFGQLADRLAHGLAVAGERLPGGGGLVVGSAGGELRGGPGGVRAERPGGGGLSPGSGPEGLPRQRRAPDDRHEPVLGRRRARVSPWRPRSRRPWPSPGARRACWRSWLPTAIIAALLGRLDRSRARAGSLPDTGAGRLRTAATIGGRSAS